MEENMSNNFITLKELVKKFNEQNIDLSNVMVSPEHVGVVHTTTAAALFYPKEDTNIVGEPEQSEETNTASSETDDTLRVTFQNFKRMFSVGTKATEKNQVPGCTHEPLKPGERNRHVLIDLSNPALQPFSDRIRNGARKRKASKVFYTLKGAMDKMDMTENVARRRLARQPCVTLINTGRRGRSVWPLKSVIAIADKD